MEIIQSHEAFVEQNNDFVYSHMKIIFKSQEGKYFYATSNERTLDLSKINVNVLGLREIPTDNVCPRYDECLTRAPEPLPPGCYIKRPSLLYYGDVDVPKDLSGQILREAQVCERLRRSPHRNIVEYFGCLVEDGRIHGLCFRKYAFTLSERVRQSDCPDLAYCLRGIKGGMEHLHKLGLVHNDLKPENIMMHESEPIIIDFDTCTYEGDPLSLKSGTEGWTPKGTTEARRENDLYSLRQIEQFLSRIASIYPHA